MNVRAASLVGLSLAALLTIACSGKTASIASPTSVEPTTPVAAAGDRGPAPPPQPVPPVSGSCDATKAQVVVGMRASSDVLDRARVEAGASSARFVRPDDRLTMEFLPSRLNVHLDRQDLIVGATCG